MNQEQFQDMFNKKITNISTQVVKYPWHNKGFYTNWLAQTYFYVQHSTRLLALSAALFPLNQEKQHKRFLMHLREETGHEKMTLNDLKKLNCNIENFKIMTSTAALFQTQYFWVQNISAISLLGWILALEGIAVYAGHDIYKNTSKSFGKDACVFLSVHADEDEDHLPKALNLITELTDEEIENIYTNFCLSCDNYLSMLEQINKSCELNNETAA